MYSNSRIHRVRALPSRWVACAAIPLTALIVLGCRDPAKPPRVEPQPTVPILPEELIQELATVYQQRDYLAFENLFPNAGDNAPYLYFLSEPLPNGQTNWDVTEELRIHRRMFNPENPLPGETPVPQALWLQSISITLTQTNPFAERSDLYQSPTNPDGLDPNVWKAIESVYVANLFFDTQTTTDYRVDGRANFVVIENLAKASGEDRKFLIYRWEDLGATVVAGSDGRTGAQSLLSGVSNASSSVEPKTWSGVKNIYRQ